jgi:hypothetical protein
LRPMSPHSLPMAVCSFGVARRWRCRCPRNPRRWICIFIKESAPVAEEAGVIIGIHSDDPPGVELGGIPSMANDPRVGTAYTMGYMQALLQRVQAEGG